MTVEIVWKAQFVGELNLIGCAFFWDRGYFSKIFANNVYEGYLQDMKYKSLRRRRLDQKQYETNLGRH